MIISVLCLVDMVLLLRPNPEVASVVRTIVCGGALYYAVKRLRRPGPMTVLFIAVAVVYNPFWTLRMEPVWWLLCDVVSMALFYLLSRITPIRESGVKRYVECDESDK